MTSLTQLAREIYRRPSIETGWSLEEYCKGSEIRYFSFGRHALYAALKSIGVAKGDRVLVPAFICRDLLSSINALGAIPEFYAVEKSLNIKDSPELLPDARVILAVNYFGFPQDMEPFRAYCARTGAVLIEDNAHGLLSRDGAGKALGTRGDFGIFSLRKTVSMPNGAALVLNSDRINCQLPSQLAFSNEPLLASFRLKRVLSRLVPYTGIFLPRLLTALGRKVRKLRTGHEIAPSPQDAETRLPENAAPCAALGDFLARVDETWEVARRRQLYVLLEGLVREAGGEPVFSGLPEHTVPYVFPFRATGDTLARIRHRLAKEGLECHPWPDLPDAVAPEAPDYYKSVWMVGFIW